MSGLPREIRKQLKSFVSQTSDQAVDLIVNLTGKYIEEKKREKLKKKAEVEVGTEIENAITDAFHMGLRLKEKFQQKELETSSLKEKFYLLTDAYFEPFVHDIPQKVHVMDYLFQVCEELLGVFRFDIRYLKHTNYSAYLQGLEKLMFELKKEDKLGKAWEVLNEFINSKDFYLLLQVTIQRLAKHYEFLARNFVKIRKKQLDKYLEIYEELSGVYEKFISLIVALMQLLRMDNGKYEVARKRGLYQNILYVERSSWEIFVSGFNRNIRNAIVHKTCKVDILKETVEFIDRNKSINLTFREVQKGTREISALLLILPHLFVLIFCFVVLSMKEMLDSIPE